ncbi:MAG: hypothetical protein WC916_01485 [Candidatus Woesearchaeota archaeon]
MVLTSIKIKGVYFPIDSTTITKPQDRKNIEEELSEIVKKRIALLRKIRTDLVTLLDLLQINKLTTEKLTKIYSVNKPVYVLFEEINGAIDTYNAIDRTPAINNFSPSWTANELIQCLEKLCLLLKKTEGKVSTTPTEQFTLF